MGSKNKNMKNRIIKLLGGITQQDHSRAFQNWKNKSADDLERMRQKTFRAGDLVYISNDKNFDPLTQYYLLEPYNNGTCWYVSKDKDDPQRREFVNGVFTGNISHDRPECCPSCKRLID